MAHLESITQQQTHRLIFAGHLQALETLPLPPAVLSDLSELDAATNERKYSEVGRGLGIGTGELLSGVPEARIVNAAFTHPGVAGSRFNDATRGAWYAGFEHDTSVKEVAFHRRLFLSDARISGRQSSEHVEYYADFLGQFHVLDQRDYEACLQPRPIPQCYAESQALAKKLLFEGSSGIVYPSVRRKSGTCIVCFRPALVFYPRRGQTYRITVEAGADFLDVEQVD